MMMKMMMNMTMMRKLKIDDDEEQTESEDDGDDFIHPKLTTHDDATYEEDQGNEAVEDTNTNLEGRDDVMPDVILPQVQATQEIEDTHVTLTLVNPDGQQQSSSVSSGFVSNMLNPNQDTAIMEPSFTAQVNRPPTLHPIVIQTQQPTINPTVGICSHNLSAATT
ncbi:hypothetical protein Tco_0279380 [Tanacetum coccineum]